jgi:hypothetical protein
MTPQFEFEKEIKLECGWFSVLYNADRGGVDELINVRKTDDLDLKQLYVQYDKWQRFASLHEVLLDILNETHIHETENPL